MDPPRWWTPPLGVYTLSHTRRTRGSHGGAEASKLSLSAGFLGEGDVVTQAIHNAQELLRTHGVSGRGKDPGDPGDRGDRDREGSKMVSNETHADTHTHTHLE